MPKKTDNPKPTGSERPKTSDMEEEEEEEEEEKVADESEAVVIEQRTTREGWLYVWRLNWVVSRFEGVPLCILAVGKAGGTKTSKAGEWADLMTRLYHERYGYAQLNAAAKIAPPAIPGQQQQEEEEEEEKTTKKKKTTGETTKTKETKGTKKKETKKKQAKKPKVARVTLDYIHQHLDYSFGDLALLLPREPESKTGLDRGERALRTVLGLSFPDDVVYDMAKELKVNITKIVGKLKATELVIAPLSTFESLRKLFRESFASKQELRLSHITSLMARAGPYTLHPDVVVEVRPGPKCDPAIFRTIAVLLPTNAPAPATATTTTTATATAIHSAGASSAVKIEETVTTYVEENGVVVIPE